MADAVTPRKRAKSVTFATPPPSRENTAFRTRITTILGGITVAGVYLSLYQSKHNGFFDSLVAIYKGDSFPGSNGEYKRVFTGIKPLDVYIQYMNPFWGLITHRGDDSSYLFWLWMIGQFGVQWGILVMESLREGNQGSVAKYLCLVGILCQNLGIASFIPPYLAILAYTSTLSRSSSPTGLMNLIKVHKVDVGLLPFSILFGFFLPALCMMLPYPAINSYGSWQGWIGAWHFFPLYTLGFHWALSKFFKAVDPGTGQKLKSEEAKTVSYFWSARPLYIAAIVICALFHVNIMAIVLLPTWLMEAFPLFGTYHNVSFASVFLPPSPLPPFEAVSAVRGVHIFLIWDMIVTGVAMLVWASLHARNIGSGAFGARWVLRALGYTLITGPSGALVMAMWDRDSTIVEQLITQAMKDK